MKRLNFKCTLLTDVVISAQTATEGRHESLNYIPGSSFLGILAASVYKDDNEESYILFHSGRVRFGDAHILCDKGQRSLQIPFCWYFPKGGMLTTKENYMISFLNRSNFDDLVSRGIILKQARNGYFTEDGHYLSINKIFSLKTAHDQKTRQSKASQMFGYEALTEGSKLKFCVDIDDVLAENKQIVEKIKKLSGKHRIGRSKTAEFSRVEIDFIDEEDNNTAVNAAPKEFQLEERMVENGRATYNTKPVNLVFLYAESRLSFRDDLNQPTFTPTPKQLGLPVSAKILWDRSQIRTGVYAPWNKKRNRRDEDRVFIEKGSVFVVDMENVKSFTTNKIIKGVGLYRTEGFGKLLINPKFLEFNPESGKATLQLEDAKPAEDILFSGPDKIDQDDVMEKWLQQQKNRFEVLEIVEDFIQAHAKKFRKVTNSQWGNVRSYAVKEENTANLINQLFRAPNNEEDDDGGYLMHGKASEQWEEGREMLKRKLKDLKEKYENDITVLQFTEELSAQMQKKGGLK